MSAPRLFFNYLDLTSPYGGRLYLLADEVCSMEHIQIDRQRPNGEKETCQAVRIKNSYGIEWICMDKVEEIQRQIETASNDAIKTMMHTASNQLVVPAGVNQAAMRR